MNVYNGYKCYSKQSHGVVVAVVSWVFWFKSKLRHVLLPNPHCDVAIITALFTMQILIHINLFNWRKKNHWFKWTDESFVHFRKLVKKWLKMIDFYLTVYSAVHACNWILLKLLRTISWNDLTQNNDSFKNRAFYHWCAHYYAWFKSNKLSVIYKKCNNLPWEDLRNY